jgi:hypothetical protein
MFYLGRPDLAERDARCLNQKARGAQAKIIEPAVNGWKEG